MGLGRKIKDTIRRVDEIGALGGGTREDQPPETTEIHWVKISSTTKTASRYPGVRQERDADLRTFTPKETCWVDAPNGETLDVGSYYPVKLAGVRSADGLAIYDILNLAFRYRYFCAGGGSGGSATGCCDSPRNDLTCTATNRTGCYLTTFTPNPFTLTDDGANGWHIPALVTISICAFFNQLDAINVQCVAGVPILNFRDGSGNALAVNPEAGYTCNPLSAVYLVNDGAGNTCTITVVE